MSKRRCLIFILISIRPKNITADELSKHSVRQVLETELFPTKDIAAVLAREANTISSLRKRLYKKVFNREGGAREWDDFILSIGT